MWQRSSRAMAFNGDELPWRLAAMSYSIVESRGR
jgi:hypothetical protein